MLDLNHYRDGSSYLKSCELPLCDTHIWLADKHNTISTVYTQEQWCLKCQFPGKQMCQINFSNSFKRMEFFQIALSY